MSVRSLPPRPDHTQLKLQARELRQSHRQGELSVAARIAAHHPRMKGLPLEAVLAKPLALADAQLVLAREYGFENWGVLKHRIELAKRVAKFKPHSRFHEALAALKAGDLERIRNLTAEDRQLVHARTNLDPRYGYFAGATLLHHVAGNPGGWEQPMPKNIVEIARALLDAGADVNAETLGPNGGTTMGLLITSKQASDANLSGALRQIVVHHIKRISFSLARFFGLGLYADFVDPRKMLAENVNYAWPGFIKNLALRKTALESTLPPHNDGVARRVSERTESCFRAQSEFL